MITINRIKFAASENEFIGSLFQSDGTANGYYKKFRNRIIFSDKDHKPQFALVRNRHGSFLVSVGQDRCGRIRYMFALSTLDETYLGLDSLSYSEMIEYAESLTKKHL